MNWKDEIRKNIFDEDPNEMTDFMNVTPRLKEAAKKRKEDEPSDSAEYMIEDIKEYCDDISIEAEDVKNRKALARALNDLMDVLATLKEADV